jgi:hypothetical protein
LLRDVLEILQLTREPLQFVSGLRFVNKHCFPRELGCVGSLGPARPS